MINRMKFTLVALLLLMTTVIFSVPVYAEENQGIINNAQYQEIEGSVVLPENEVIYGEDFIIIRDYQNSLTSPELELMRDYTKNTRAIAWLLIGKAIISFVGGVIGI